MVAAEEEMNQTIVNDQEDQMESDKEVHEKKRYDVKLPVGDNTDADEFEREVQLAQAYMQEERLTTRKKKVKISSETARKILLEIFED